MAVIEVLVAMEIFTSQLGNIDGPGRLQLGLGFAESKRQDVRGAKPQKPNLGFVGRLQKMPCLDFQILIDYRRR